MSELSIRTLIDETERDLHALQGSWKQIGHEADGLSEPPDEHGAPGALTTFAGNQFVVRGVDGVLLLAGTFTIDASNRPKAITWTDSMGPDQGKQLPAIYKLEADFLVFIAGDEGSPRPTVFQTSIGQTKRTFVRQR